MIQLGNRKIGPKVWTWSLPVVRTCPGASQACLSVCYARTGFMAFPSIKTSHRKNLAATKRQDFCDRMVFYLKEYLVEQFRIHAAGDFASNEYIDKWREITRRSRSVEFLAYTRSWSVPELRQNVLRLGREPNLSLFLSWDRSMPKPPRTRLPICYMSLNDEDLPRRRVDLVFRNRPKTVMKKTPNGSQVCAYETGATRTTCSQCRLCWNEKPAARLVQLV